MDLSEVTRLEEWQKSPAKRLARLLREAARQCLKRTKGRYSRLGRTSDGVCEMRYCAMGAAYLVAHQLKPGEELVSDVVDVWGRWQFGYLHDFVVGWNDGNGMPFERIADKLESDEWT
jgi:hypothetical protein